MILALVIATAVTGAIGLAVKDLAEMMSPFAISLCFVVTGAVLFLSGRLVPSSPVSVPGIRQALIVGLAQGIGVFPGISRSGSTISASLLGGLDRRAAGEFSFLLSIPAILAAFILELKDADTLIGSVPRYPSSPGW
jgi:undecaprenyl-diphosphatase